ncbi:MAG: ATP-binding cassette domain-containing protein [Acidimicrobiia bacterium]
MSLELRAIHKHFGTVRANDGVSLTVERGSLHGLLGENGAGKSTLMKVLSGFIEADSGQVLLDGESVALTSPRDAIAAGIGMLHQDPLVFLPFSVLDNFLLGSRDTSDGSAAMAELERLSRTFGFAFDPDAPARSLTVGERQQLEIVRLLSLGAKVLILDEPTTGISASQQALLFDTLRTLAAEGMIVIFVSHKLEEVEALCDRVTVMRRGRAVGELPLPAPVERLVEMMFGHAVEVAERSPGSPGMAALALDGVAATDRLTALEGLSLEIRQGEVIGLAGLEGSGQRTLLRTCAGLIAPTSGTVHCGDADLTPRGYHERLAAGIHYVPAGRLEEGLIQGVTITEHFLLCAPKTAPVIDWSAARRAARAKIEEHAIVGTAESSAESLSGGNQQRLLLAMMPDEVRVLLMEHPTRGLDISSADWVWTKLLERVAKGTAIVFSSADLDELLRYSDRIVVFFAGRVFKVLDARETDGTRLAHLIGGKDLP